MLERELFLLMEGTADGAFTVTESGEIVAWNKAAEKLFGYPAADVLHKSCYEIMEGVGALGTHVCHENCSVLECAGGNISTIPNFDLHVKTLSGPRIWVNISTIVFDNKRTGRRLLVHLAHDITSQKRTEEIVARMLELSHQLEAAGESRGRPAPVVPLSDQEKHVLRMFAAGKDSSEVARQLHISSQTLRNHLHHINQKLRTHNRLEAVMQALQRKLI